MVTRCAQAADAAWKKGFHGEVYLENRAFSAIIVEISVVRGFHKPALQSPLSEQRRVLNKSFKALSLHAVFLHTLL